MSKLNRGAVTMAVLACLLALPLFAGRGNRTSLGPNAFNYLLGLIQGLQAQTDGLQKQTNGLQAQANGLQAQTGGLQEQIDGLQAQIGDQADASACMDVSKVIVGTWSVANAGTGTSGQVTFDANGTYTVDSGIYNAGGSFLHKSSGTYDVLPGGAIAFTYAGWIGPNPVSRIAVVTCAGKDEISHFVMGHTHDYEVLTRIP